jgi:hypothetical protein
MIWVCLTMPSLSGNQHPIEIPLIGANIATYFIDRRSDANIRRRSV